MSHKSELQDNNADLRAILNTIKALPDKTETSAEESE